MKKYLIVIIIILFNYCLTVSKLYSKSYTQYKVDEKVPQRIYVNKKLSLDLPSGPGEWVVSDRWGERIEGSLVFSETNFAMLQDNEVVKTVSIGQFQGTYYSSILNQIILQVTFNSPIEGFACSKYKGNTLHEYIKIGAAHNCVVARHLDVQRSLYNPIDPELKNDTVEFRHWIKQNGYKVPDLVLCSTHSYFARTQGNRWFVIDYCDHPKFYGAKKKYNPDRYNSEFHPENIDKYPEVKKIMNKFVKKTIERQRTIEKAYKMPKRHVLKFSNITSVNSNNLADDLKKLSDLYNKGALTKEEYEKAKKNLLK